MVGLRTIWVDTKTHGSAHSWSIQYLKDTLSTHVTTVTNVSRSRDRYHLETERRVDLGIQQDGHERPINAFVACGSIVKRRLDDKT